MTLSDIEVRDTVDVAPLRELFRSAWWTSDRDADDIAQMLGGSDLVVALVHRPSGRLAGFTRVLTDGVYLAVILDLIVAPDARGTGLGALLMDTVLGHSRVAGVRSVELVCQPELMPFYRRWGFTERVGRSRLMRRTADARLAS